MVGNVKELQGKSTFDELVDRDAAARFLEVSPRTLDRWHLLREGPPRIRYGCGALLIARNRGLAQRARNQFTRFDDGGTAEARLPSDGGTV